MEGGQIEVSAREFIHSLSQNLAQRLSAIEDTAFLVDNTFTHRHIAIHFVLQRSSSLNSSSTVQLICERRVMYILIIITYVREANQIPVLLIIARDDVIYIRYQEFCFLLIWIRSNRIILTIEPRFESDMTGSRYVDIEVYITYGIERLSRESFASLLVSGNFALTIILQTVFLQQVFLRTQTFIYRYSDLSGQ